MANVTLYVKDADVALIDAAKKELGESLSSVFVDCVRERMDRAKEPDIDSMEKITLAFWRSKDEPFKWVYKSFTGRWLVGDANEGLRAADDSRPGDTGSEWSVAQTKQGKVVVYHRHCNNGWAPEMEVFDSFESFKDAEDSGGYAKHPQNVVAAVAAKLDEPYEIELDI